MTELTQDTIVETAAEAAHNANASRARALGVSNNDAPLWHDAPDAEKATKREVTKSILGLPNTLTDKDEVNVGHVNLFVSIVHAILHAFGFGVLAQVPQFQLAPQPEPVTDPAPTSEAPTTAEPAHPVDVAAQTAVEAAPVPVPDGSVAGPEPVVPVVTASTPPVAPVPSDSRVPDTQLTEPQIAAAIAPAQEPSNDGGQPAGTNLG